MGGISIVKRKTILSLALCTRLIAAMSVTAFAETSATCTVSGPASISAGETIQITVTFVCHEDWYADIQTSGLTFVGTSDSLCAQENKIELWGMGQYDEPDVMALTYTYTVSAQPGETASFSATNIHDFSEPQNSLPNASWSATVPGGSEPEQPSSQPTDGGSNQPAPPSSNGNSSNSSGGTNNSSGNSNSNSNGSSGSAATTNKDRVPKTGDASMDLWILAVLGTACAVITGVAGKKVLTK